MIIIVIQIRFHSIKVQKTSYQYHYYQNLKLIALENYGECI